MQTLPLTQNKVALVDDSDYQALNQWKWTYLPNGRSGYAVRWETKGGERRTIYMHRQITGAEKGQLVDHEDGNGLNNQRENLRLCNQSRNQANKPMPARSIPYRGVYRDTHRENYFAAIKFQGCMMRMGNFTFAELEIAARIRDRAALHFFGSFARLNFPDDVEVTRALPLPSAIRRRLEAPKQLALDLSGDAPLPDLPVSRDMGRSEALILQAWRTARVLAPTGSLDDDLL